MITLCLGSKQAVLQLVNGRQTPYSRIEAVFPLMVPVVVCTIGPGNFPTVVLCGLSC